MITLGNTLKEWHTVSYKVTTSQDMYGCYIKLDLPLKSPTSKAAFIESWDETAQGINMFVWIAASKRGGVMFFPSLVCAFMRKPNDSWESNSHAPSILSWRLKVERHLAFVNKPHSLTLPRGRQVWCLSGYQLYVRLCVTALIIWHMHQIVGNGQSSVHCVVIICLPHTCIIRAGAFSIPSFFCGVSVLRCNVCALFKILQNK